MSQQSTGTDISTSERILDVAEDIVRSRGYNGFSYADVASELQLTKASLHHHFPTKGDLGLALIQRFSSNVLAYLQELDRASDCEYDKLKAYFEVYQGALSENKMCLCGMLAAEHETLPAEMQGGINQFFDGHVDWLERVLQAGRESGEFVFQGTPSENARSILASMQGGLMIAKSQHSTATLEIISKNLLRMYRGGGD
ncbi:MAG: TetR/AcrR family transcriptional regulator [Hyphomicrobiaceae bacterium]